ncbi:MAG: DUF1934 domain-containing protein [Acidaminococcaceae bacterium]
MQPVKISITSHSETAGDCEDLATISYGQMTRRAYKYYVLYEETAQTGLIGTKTTIKWDEKQVTVIRRGAFEHRQDFAVGLLDESLYQTPYLAVKLQVTTKCLQFIEQAKSWHLHIEYTRIMEGGSPSAVSLEIVIEEAKESEY